MTPEDWKRAEEFVRYSAKKMTEHEGKPDSEPKPHDPYDVALEREEFGDYTKAVDRVQPEPAKLECVRCNQEIKGKPWCLCHRCGQPLCGITCEEWHLEKDCGEPVPSTSVEPQVEPSYVISTTGDGASSWLVSERNLRDELHKAYCCCGVQSWMDCKTEGVIESVKLIDDEDNWSHDYPDYQRHIFTDHGEDYTLQVIRLTAAVDSVSHPPAWKHIPEQYKKERWGVDYDEKNSTFFVHSGGYRIADAEDSEVAHAICNAFNQDSVSHPPLEQEARELAQLFHETYERLAPDFGYVTRQESAVPWKLVPDRNKNLMIAVCKEVLAVIRERSKP